MLFGSRNKLATINPPKIVLTSDTEAMQQLAYERAVQYFDKGYNCAQSVILASSDVLDIEVPPIIIRGAAAFTGGIGFSGCTCGALVGASLFIGTLSADETKPRKNKNATDLSGEFHNMFRDRFKTTCCRSLRKGKGFNDRASNKECRDITALTAEMLVDMLARATALK